MDEDAKREIVGKRELIERILNNETKYHSIEQCSDIILKTLFELLKEGKSFRYNDESPLIRTKISKANLNTSSPRTARKNHIICTIKIKD